jgi:hypothetical protein
VYRAHLVRPPLRCLPTKLPIVILVAIVLFAGPAVAHASTIDSRILIDPVGENHADFFGTSVAWVGGRRLQGSDSPPRAPTRHASF